MTAPPDVPPPLLGHYRVLRLLGAGGMGEVWLAHDDRLHRDVAVKVLLPDATADESRLRRFLLEARAASALSHPVVAQIYDVDENVPFIAMEYVDGSSLDRRLREGPLEIDLALTIALEVADALDEAHTKGIVHRDIKPGNLMLTGRGRVKILDFGLAKFRAVPVGRQTDQPTAPLTQANVVLGTPHYMSPEQALGREVDARSDLFSLGVVLYEMLAGCLPFLGSSSGEVLDRILRQPPPPLLRFRSGLPAELERVVLKCLEKDPALRYQTARDLLVDLRRFKRDSDSGRTSPARHRHLVPAGPLRWWVIDLALCVLFMPVVVALGWWARQAVGDVLGLGLFLSLLLCQAASSTIRLYLLALHLFHARHLRQEVHRSLPLSRAADGLLMASFLAGGMTLAPTEHVALGATLLALGTAGVLRVFLVEPGIVREAFPAGHPVEGATETAGQDTQGR